MTIPWIVLILVVVLLIGAATFEVVSSKVERFGSSVAAFVVGLMVLYVVLGFIVAIDYS